MEPDNLLLDRYIIKQTNKRNPKVCFLGTASGDAEGYALSFYKGFAELHCQPSVLSLIHLPTKDLESFILDKDVIYVGGGNTRSLLALWREWKVDGYLRKAWENGVVLAGISAGSICWFEEGVSDFFPGELNRLQCLGFLKGSNCPHYDGEAERRPAYHRLILRNQISDGVAADDGVALHYVGTELVNVVSSSKGARAYRVRKIGNRVKEQVIRPKFLGK